MFPGLARKLSFLRTIITKAKIIATKLRKKTFCMVGRSPDRRTKVFIPVKHNPDSKMQKMPMVLLLVLATAPTSYLIVSR